MNERIRELAAAARHYTNDTVLHLERVHNRDYSFEEINEILDAKFAELIMQECFNTIAKEGDGQSWDDWDRGYNMGLNAAILSIKKHLGVTE